MAFLLKDNIWGYFGPAEGLNDTYKVNGRGLRQRYNEILAEDFDEVVGPAVDNLIKNTVIPSTALLKFLPYLEDMLGGRALITNDEATRRRILRFMIRFRQVAGTRLGYSLLFNTIGIKCTVLEHFEFKTFDMGTFDEPGRTFDMGVCDQHCTEYTLLLVGIPNLTDELQQFIENAIELQEPINADLRNWYYLSADDTDSDGSHEIDSLQFANIVANAEATYLGGDGSIVITAQGGVPPYQYDVELVPVVLEITNVSHTNEITYGVHDGTITITAIGGIGPFSYSLDGVSYFANSGVFIGVAPGVYTVYVKDNTGAIVSQAGITIGIGKPANPVAANATDIAVDSFTANVNAVAGATKYYLDVNEAADFTGTAILTNFDNGAALFKSVTGLTTGVPYYFRWRAENSVGLSGNSNVKTVTLYAAMTIAFMTATGIPDDGTVYFAASPQEITGHALWQVIDNLVSDLDFYNLLTVARVVLPNIGGTASTHKWNLIDPRDLDAAYRTTFVGGVAHTGLGVKGNFANAGANTHYNTSTNQADKFTFSLYNTEAPTLSGRAIGCDDGLGHYFQIGFNADGHIYQYGYSGADANDLHGGGAGCFTIVREDNSTRKLKVNSRAIVTKISGTGTNPNQEINYLSDNSAGTLGQFIDNGVGFIYISDDSLTDMQISDLNTVAQNHNVRLNRNPV